MKKKLMQAVITALIAGAGYKAGITKIAKENDVPRGDVIEAIQTERKNAVAVVDVWMAVTDAKKVEVSDIYAAAICAPAQTQECNDAERKSFAVPLCDATSAVRAHALRARLTWGQWLMLRGIGQSPGVTVIRPFRRVDVKAWLLSNGLHPCTDQDLKPKAVGMIR